MKIRIRGNSLRYRLTKSEVATLLAKDCIEEQTQFAGKALTYAVVATDADILSSDFNGERIVLYMPKAMIRLWNATDTVGFAETSAAVSLLIEKDFACLDNSEEDQSDNYPNPLIKC